MTGAMFRAVVLTGIRRACRSMRWQWRSTRARTDLAVVATTQHEAEESTLSVTIVQALHHSREAADALSAQSVDLRAGSWWAGTRQPLLPGGNLEVPSSLEGVLEVGVCRPYRSHCSRSGYRSAQVVPVTYRAGER